MKPNAQAEIARMREKAAKLAARVHQETVYRQMRATFIKQLSEYVQARIDDLNKVIGV